MRALNQVLGDKETYISRFEELLPLLADTSKLDQKLKEKQDECDDILNSMRRYMGTNTRQTQDQEQYIRQFDEMSEAYKEAEKRVLEIKDELLERSARKERICRFLDELRQAGDIVTEFDDRLWYAQWSQ